MNEKYTAGDHVIIVERITNQQFEIGQEVVLLFNFSHNVWKARGLDKTQSFFIHSDEFRLAGKTTL